jgi:hypothetical protein
VAERGNLANTGALIKRVYRFSANGAAFQPEGGANGEIRLIRVKHGIR